MRRKRRQISIALGLALLFVLPGAASSGDWGGGWVRSASGTYFFAFYVVDVCGV